VGCEPALLRVFIVYFYLVSKSEHCQPNFTQKMQSNVTLFIILAIYIFFQPVKRAKRGFANGRGIGQNLNQSNEIDLLDFKSFPLAFEG